jgi:hypothetical protein
MKATAKKAMRLPATKPAPSPLTSSDIKVLHFVEQNEVKDFQFRQKGASRGADGVLSKHTRFLAVQHALVT